MGAHRAVGPRHPWFHAVGRLLRGPWLRTALDLLWVVPAFVFLPVYILVEVLVDRAGAGAFERGAADFRHVARVMGPGAARADRSRMFHRSTGHPRSKPPHIHVPVHYGH